MGRVASHDGGLACSVAAFLIPLSGHQALHPPARYAAWGWVLQFGFFVPLALRRRYPCAVFAVVAAAAFVQWAWTCCCRRWTSRC